MLIILKLPKALWATQNALVGLIWATCLRLGDKVRYTGKRSWKNFVSSINKYYFRVNMKSLLQSMVLEKSRKFELSSLRCAEAKICVSQLWHLLFEQESVSHHFYS